MGYVLDDHDKGIHAEARRESFLLYDDFGHGFHLELDWSKLDELAFLVRRLVKYRKEHVAGKNQS